MPQNNSGQTAYWPWIICAIYFFTGVTALGYEVLWARMLSTLFGVSIFGVVITVSAFMAGLGVGSLVGGKLQHLLKSPLLYFALAEFVVALFAFNLPIILAEVDAFISAVTLESSFSVWFSYQSVFTFLLMMLPAFILGLGFPMVLGALGNTSVPLAVIYGANTVGGMLGALLPLVLLPFAGWIVADRLLAILGMFLSFCVVLVHFIIKKRVSWSPVPKASVGRANARPLLAYAAVGASAIILQIAWTRMYGMVLLRTEYVMAIILATFLAGIGIGSLLAAKIRFKHSLLFISLLISITAVMSVYALPWVSAWAESVEYGSLVDSMFWQSIVIACCTLPATLAFGAWFPVIASSYQSEPKMSAYLYGANSIGAALGGLVVGFIIFPIFGTTTSILFAVLLLLISSNMWIKHGWYKFSPIVFALLFLPVLSMPNVSALLPVSQPDSKNLSIYEDAISLTHVVEDKFGQRMLLSDLQRMDASTDPTAITVQKNQARLPLLLHHKPQSVLFLGLGTGITASGSLPYPKLDRTAVELSQGAINAAGTFFSQSNGEVVSKLKIVQDDARRYLKSVNNNYDVIVGDLFHPDLVGRSNLLSLQQFKRAKNRLKQDGIFVQWVALNQFDLKTLKVVLETFRSVFPVNMIFMDGFRLGLVGFNGEFHGISGIKENLQRLGVSGQKDITGGEGVWTWLGRYWGAIPQLNSSIQDEWAPVIEFQLPKAKFDRQIDLSELLAFLSRNRPRADVAVLDLMIGKSDSDYFKQAYMASEMYVESWSAYFRGQSEESQKLLSMAYSANPDDQWIGFGLADAMFGSVEQATNQGYSEQEILEKILSIRPDHIDALKASMHLHKNKGDSGKVKQLVERLRELSPFDKGVREGLYLSGE